MDYDVARYEAVLSALQSRHPGVAALTQSEALCELPGPAPGDPVRAAIQRVQSGRYPWPRRRIGGSGRWYVLLADIATVLSGVADTDVSAMASTTTPRPLGHRPGRPRKTAPAIADGGAA